MTSSSVAGWSRGGAGFSSGGIISVGFGSCGFEQVPKKAAVILVE